MRCGLEVGPEVGGSSRLNAGKPAHSVLFLKQADGANDIGNSCFYCVSSRN